MKTKIKFKALKKGKIVYKNLFIEHPVFYIIPPELFNGFECPSLSVENQVIDYLDGIDKSDIMIKYEWDAILDYYPYIKKARKNEIEEFVAYIKPYLEMYPSLMRPAEAVISEAKEILFGRGKSNETKAKEMIKMIDMTILASMGTLDALKKSFELKQIE